MTPTIYELKITLKDSKPPIWRKVAVSGDLTLGDLHQVLQIVMGWEDDHLHQFILKEKAPKPAPGSAPGQSGLRGLSPAPEAARRSAQGRDDFGGFMDLVGKGERYFVGRAPDGTDVDMDGEGEDEYSITLAEAFAADGAKLTYEYDFGDGWEHAVEVKKIYPPKEGVAYPVCLEGALACPPEDCGGIWGYYDLLAALADPKHENHEDMMEWLGGPIDPEAFDLAAVNADLANWWKQRQKDEQKRQRKPNLRLRR